MKNNHKLLTTVTALSRLADNYDLTEPQILAQAQDLIGTLVAQDDWLPAAMTVPHPQFYRQYLLYGDPLNRFSLVSFVWGPGQQTPIHDHTVWGVIGMLRGAETAQAYKTTPDGFVADGPAQTLHAGDVVCVSPTIGDIHHVSNAFDDQVSISIHLYGGNIGRIERHVYEPNSGEQKSFVSGYSNATVPNLWWQE